MGESFSVTPGNLSAAAGQVDGVASGLRACSSAAGSEGVGGLVYGVLFDPTALPLLSQAKDTYRQAYESAAQVADEIAAALRDSADSYTKIDGEIHDGFGAFDPDTVVIP